RAGAPGLCQPGARTLLERSRLRGVLRAPQFPLRHPEPAPAVLLPRALRGHQRIVRRAHRRDGTSERRRQRLAGELLERGLRIEEVEVAGPTLHEEPDDRFCRGRMVRSGHGSLERRKPAIAREQVVQRDRAETAPRALEEFTPGLDANDMRDSHGSLLLVSLLWIRRCARPSVAVGKLV